jgi:flagellar motor switch protein FliG
VGARAGATEEEQLNLTEAMGKMRMIDRGTLRLVVEEFVTELDSVGLAFPGGLEGALGVLEGHISAATASRLRRQALVAGTGDPWARLAGLAPEPLLALLQAESVEIGAVVLSKLSVARAAELLGKLPGDKARRIARAIADTSRIAPEMVHRIGLALVQQIEAEPDAAFDTTPVERVGAILNYSPAATRDDVLEGLEQEDAEFAAEVRKAIFTFFDIPYRVDLRDITKIIKECDQAVLITALAAAMAKGEDGNKIADFLFSGMSQRMSGQLKDEVADCGTVKEQDGETAMAGVVGAIRALEARGELVMVSNDR